CLEGRLVHAGLDVHDRGSGVEARAPYGRVGRQPLVEDPRYDAEQRGPQPRAAGGTRCERQPAPIDCERRRHHALHPLARVELTSNQVGLAEHAVEMEIEVRKEVTRAETEAGGEHTRISVTVDDADVRRVTAFKGRSLE